MGELRAYKISNQERVRGRAEKTGRQRTCQTITPAFHPFAFACFTHDPSVAGSMYPFDASAAVAGLPMTSLLISTPDLTISKSADPPALFTSVLQSSYPGPGISDGDKGQLKSQCTNDIAAD